MTELIVLAGLVAGLLLLRWAVTRLLRHSRSAADWLAPGAMRSVAWWRRHRLHGWLLQRHPRIYHWSARRLSWRRADGLMLTLLAVAALGMIVTLWGLTSEVLELETKTLDDAVNQGFGPWRTPLLVRVVSWITNLGAGPAITALSITAAGFLWAHGRGRLILPLVVTVLGSQLTTYAAKYLFNRARPEFLDFATASTPSYPSGHTSAAVAVYGFVAYAIARELRQPRHQLEIAYWASALIMMIACSRMFLSVHFLTDVASGALLGSAWLLVGFAIAERQRALGER